MINPGDSVTGERSREWTLLETAWGIIANAGGGDWETQTEDWREAAGKWREAYHDYLTDEIRIELAEPVPPVPEGEERESERLRTQMRYALDSLERGKNYDAKERLSEVLRLHDEKVQS